MNNFPIALVPRKKLRKPRIQDNPIIKRKDQREANRQFLLSIVNVNGKERYPDWVPLPEDTPRAVLKEYDHLLKQHNFISLYAPHWNDLFDIMQRRRAKGGDLHGQEPVVNEKIPEPPCVVVEEPVRATSTLRSKDYCWIAILMGIGLGVLVTLVRSA